MKNFNVAAALIMVGLIVLGFCVRGGLIGMKRSERTVSVRGLAEKEVKADKVTWPLVIKIVGNDMGTVYSELNKSNEIVKQFLTSKGIPENEITQNAPKIVDMAAEIYNQDYKIRYNVTSVITVSSDKVDLVRSLVNQQGELLKQGVAISASDYEYQISYEYTSLNEIKPEMIEKATKNAREAAEKFAKDSDSRLGKIKNASQGQFSISDRDSNTPFIKNVRVVTTVNYFLNN